MPLPSPTNTTDKQASQGGGGLQKPGQQQQQQKKAKPPPPGWNPSGYWPDPYDSRYKESFRPHEFIGMLNQSPEAQAYGDVEGAAGTLGVQGLREGEKAATDEAQQEAANQGLGRGFAQQAGTNIRQQTNQAVADTLLGAHLEGVSRRYQQAAMLASSLIEGNKARYNYFLQKKAIQASEDAAQLGFWGDVLGGALEAVGSVIPGLGGDDDEESGGGGGPQPNYVQ